MQTYFVLSSLAKKDKNIKIGYKKDKNIWICINLKPNKLLIDKIETNIKTT